MSEEGGDTADRPSSAGVAYRSDSLPGWVRFARRIVPSFVRRQYAAKFVLSLLAVVLVVSLVGAATFLQVRGVTQAETRADLESIASARAASVETWVDAKRSQTHLVASASGAVTADERSAYLQTVLNRTDTDVVGVHYVDLDAQRITASSNPEYRYRRLGDHGDRWQTLTTRARTSGSTAVVSTRLYTEADRRVVAFASPVPQRRAVIVLVTDVTSLRATVNASRAGIMTRLVTTNGHPVVDAPAADDHSLGSTLATAAASGNRTVTSGSHVRSYAPIEQSEWVLVTEAAREGPVIAVLGRSVVAMVAAVVVTLLVVGVILGRQTVVPLVKLRRVIERMEEGDLDVDLRTDREDEIGRLYEAFGQMSTALREQVREAKEVRREAERSKQELERQNDRLDQFASTLSHDLRNPLAVARGHVELLATTIDSDEYPDMEEHVAKIDDAHDRIDDIIGDVLTLTRKGESVEEIERFQLESTAREAWGNIDSKDATMVVEESRVIEGDRTRLLRAFENLFRNSLDHGSDDVTVTVGLTKNGFYVQDDGPGIPDDELEHIFDYGHTTSEDGTGLGLSIVKTIVEAHGWSIWIDVTYGDGARFVFTDVFENESEPFAETEFTWAETLRQQ